MVENDSSATRGSPPTIALKVPAAPTAMSASCSGSGSGSTAQSANTIRPSLPQRASGCAITNAEETVFIPGAAPIACSAARTVSAVVRTAPPTEASHSPAATSREAK